VPDASHLAVFTVAALTLLLVPGPAVLYIVAQSMAHGRRAGVAAVAGIHSGTLVHVVAATVGLSALLASSALAFDAVKYAGAAYLIVVGLQRLFGAVHEPAPREASSLYRQGIVVNVLNPKTALFFLAFLPQFATNWRGILVLGLAFSLLGACTDGAYALLAGTFGDRLRRHRTLQQRLSAIVFVGLGAFAALSAPPKHT
jgi:threonine/homoserine/homoserine lactone efflux protein